MSAKTPNGVKITEGTIGKGMLLFFLPIMIGTLLQQLYNTVDAVIIGRALGKVALACVGGSSAKISSVTVNFFVAMSSGAGILISQYCGADSRQQIRRGVNSAMVLSLLFGAIITVLGLSFTRPLLALMKTTADTIEGSASYLTYYFLGMIPAMIYNMGSGVLRAMGDSRRPLYYLAACVVVNTGLDLLFVLVFQWGIRGAAIATSLSQVVCAVLVLRALMRLPEEYRLRPSRETVSISMTRRMVRIGFPAGVQSMMYGIANMVLQSAVNMLGTSSMAAWTAFEKMDNFFWPISNAIGVAVMTFVGQNYGAGNRERVKGSVKSGLALHAGASVVFSTLAFFLRYPMMHLFVGDDAEVVEIGATVALICCGYIAFTCVEIFSAAMRGVGNSLIPALITMVCVCGVRLAYLWLWGFDHLSNMSIALVYPATWLLSSIVFALYYRSGKWMPRKRLI